MKSCKISAISRSTSQQRAHSALKSPVGSNADDPGLSNREPSRRFRVSTLTTTACKPMPFWALLRRISGSSLEYFWHPGTPQLIHRHVQSNEAGNLDNIPSLADGLEAHVANGEPHIREDLQPATRKDPAQPQRDWVPFGDRDVLEDCGLHQLS